MAFLARIRLDCAGFAEDKGMKRFAIVWPGFTGYMGDCWRALAARHEVRVWIEPSRYEQEFDGSELAGVDSRRVVHGFERTAVEEMKTFTPDAMLVCGWSTPLAVAAGAAKMPCRKVIAFDMPWERSLRKFVARWALWPKLRHFDAAFVPGKRAARYAKWLGFGTVVEGSNPSGWERFSRAARAETPKRFVFVGRFSKEKGIAVLLEAYAKYRDAVDDPWSLDLAGSGDAEMRKQDGVKVLGFVRPENMPELVADHGALVLPSLWEPWGISAMEAMAAGLATIATDACGFTSEAMPTVLCHAGDVDGLCNAMVKVSRMGFDERGAERMRAMQCAEKYSARKWVERLESLCQ